jgi:hypothetical protein
VGQIILVNKLRTIQTINSICYNKCKLCYLWKMKEELSVMNKIIALILCLLIIPVSILGCDEKMAEVIIKPEINQDSP